MTFRRYGTFTGGIDLPDEKRPTLTSAVAPWPTPARVVVPLSAGRGGAGRLAVRLGENVHVGQPLTATADGQRRVVSPVSGFLAEQTRAAVLVGSSFAVVDAVEIKHIREMPAWSPGQQKRNWREIDGEELLARMAEAGLVRHAPTPVLLADWLDAARRATCRRLILNAMENRPMVTVDHRLLIERGAEVLAGLGILGRVLGVREMILAVDVRRTGAYQDTAGLAVRLGVERVALAHKYPTGAEAILVKVLTRREVPLGGSGLDVGAAVIEPATCLAVYRAIACDEAPLGRVVTVAGPGATREGNFFVPLGLPCDDMVAPVADDRGRRICGDPMTGQRLVSGAVVTEATSAVLGLPPSRAPVPTQCVRCGWCTDHCPARLNVAALNDAYELKRVTRARRAGVEACVGCGVCTYVCPARLPLAQRVRQLVHAVADLRRDADLLHGST